MGVGNPRKYKKIERFLPSSASNVLSSSFRQFHRYFTNVSAATLVEGARRCAVAIEEKLAVITGSILLVFIIPDISITTYVWLFTLLAPLFLTDLKTPLAAICYILTFRWFISSIPALHSVSGRGRERWVLKCSRSVWASEYSSQWVRSEWEKNKFSEISHFVNSDSSQ